MMLISWLVWEQPPIARADKGDTKAVWSTNTSTALAPPWTKKKEEEENGDIHPHDGGGKAK